METNNQPPEENNPWDALDREYAHRKHLVGTVIERDGKCYLQFIDGELEITPEHINKMKGVSAYLIRLIKNQQERYKQNQINWKRLEDLPKDFDTFSRVDLFVEDLETVFAQLIDEEDIITMWPKLRLMADVLVTKADEMQYDYSPHSTQLRAYYKTKLQGLRTRWESTYQLSKEQKREPDTSTTSDIDDSIRPFSELLTASYSESEFTALLIHLRMRDDTGKNIWPKSKKAALHGVIDALQKKKYLVETSRKEQMSSLCDYLGLSQGRVKNGYSKIQSKASTAALSFLNQSVSSV